LPAATLENVSRSEVIERQRALHRNEIKKPQLAHVLMIQRVDLALPVETHPYHQSEVP
jgi:hypothetical protein